MKCEHCQLQLLPYLYELLDEQDRVATADHLANCPACQEALRIAKEQQGMLAEAVREPRSDIVFAAPALATAVKAAPTLVLPIPAPENEAFRPRRRSLFLLNRWSIAAGIMLFVFSAGGLICWIGWSEQSAAIAQSQLRLANAQQELANAQNVINKKKSENQREIRAIQDQIDKLFRDWKKEETTTRKVIEDKRVSLTIIGPQNVQAGANNKYQVQFANKDHPLLLNKGQQENKGNNVAGSAPQLQVRAVDQKTQKILYEQNIRLQGNQGQGNFDLPPDLPIQPGQQIELQFQTQTDDGKPVFLSDNLNLVFPEYVTHLTTDRPMYRPGETIRFRSLTLERFSLKPAQQPFHLRYRILGPRNEEIYKADVASKVVLGKNNAPIKGPMDENLFGIGAGEFVLPANLPGGQYSLIVSEINDRFHEEKRNFLVHQWQAPRFSRDVQFHRSSYGAGDQVKMTVRVTPIQGGVGMNFKNNISVTVEPTLDGVALQQMNRQTDVDGRVDFDFNLPAQITKGEGRVTIICSDGATQETIQRTLPIIVRDLQVEFFPEGGDLIVGVPNRVYFQARTLANRPADIEGRIVDDKGAEVARVKTITDEQESGINQGLGSFTFTPLAKRTYSLRIDAPIGIARPIALPKAKDRGVVLNVAQGVAENDIKVTLHNVKDRRELLVGAYCRGRLLGHQLISIDANKQATVALKPAVNVAGVYRITVFEKKIVANEVVFRPLAERLIYRKNSERVDVTVESDRAGYEPADSVSLKLHAHNEKKEYVSAVALVAVVDNSVLKLVDDKKARSMPTHFFLTTEIRNPDDLESADVFLGDHPKAALSLDLLLGSQGWRRFAEQDPVQFQRRQQQAKQPAFLANSSQVPQFLDAEQKLIEQLDQKFVTTAVELQKKLAEREGNEARPKEMFDEVNFKHIAVEQIRNEIANSEQNLRRTHAFLWQFVLGGILLTLFFIGFYLLSVGLRRLSDGENPVVWFVLGFGLFAFLFLASIIGTFALMGENLMDVDDFRFGGRNVAVKVAAPPMPAIQLWNEMAPPAGPLPILPDEEPDANAPINDFQNKDNPNIVAAPPKGIDVIENQRLALNNNANFLNGQNFIPEKLDPQDERALRQQGQYQAILLKRVGRRVQLPAANDPSIVREYAHLRQPKKDDVRRDFTETIYWHPVLVMPDGKAQVKFDLSDAVTSYQVLVLSHTADGRLGSNASKLVAKLPFSINPTVPQEVTNTDLLTIPVAVNNDSGKPTPVTLGARFKNLELVDKQADRGLNLDANQRKRELFNVRPTIVNGTASVRMTGKTTGNGDSIERSFKVVPDGFPINGSISGVLENKLEHEITLPQDWLPGSLKLQAQFYPSPLAELQNGLESMLREPTGCFEQSSSSNYPNVMILNLMKQNNQANPLAEKQARQLLHSGYQKLTSFECIDPNLSTLKRGYEWFGQTAPPHEALTAYGLMQFRDMAKVYQVEPDMLQRTEQYLLDQRDGKGGFKRNPRGLDQFGRAPDPVTNAYIVWALTESGIKENLDVELASLREQTKASKDSYFLALAALSHLNRKKTDEGFEMLRALQRRQKASGEVPGAQLSITGSQGRDLLIETTSLAVLGWLKADPKEFQEPIRASVKWLGQQRRDGSFGGTQATILTLKAMVAYSQKYPRALQGGKVELMVRGTQPREVQQQQAFNQFGQGGPPGAVEFDTPDTARATFSVRSQDTLILKLRDTNVLRPGKNLIELNVTGANQIPYSLTWSYRTNQPANDANAPVKLTTKLSKTDAKEGEAVTLNAVIENVTAKGQGMTVAVSGLPAGLTLPDGFEQLKALTQLKEKGSISAWELRGRELVFYWRDLAPDAKIALDIDLICRLPGNYRGPASRAYLYYDADRKYWTEPLGMRIHEVE